MVQYIPSRVKVHLVLCVAASEHLAAEGVGVAHSLLGLLSFTSRLDGADVLIIVLEQV